MSRCITRVPSTRPAAWAITSTAITMRALGGITSRGKERWALLGSQGPRGSYPSTTDVSHSFLLPERMIGRKISFFIEINVHSSLTGTQH